jgi:spermidine/putrescine transport system ATP-binding protein
MKEDVILKLEHIEKGFGDVKVLKNIDLSIRRGEFITLLGSSGCGKTTTLRIIAGLEMPDKGRVLLEGKDVTLDEPNKRNVNTVFQNYALFPHMTVNANIGYSLKLKHTDKAVMARMVEEALELVQLKGFEKRLPNELSGGQRQRVAIARALVNKPKVLLLDEPLGALDLQLRHQMQIELKRLQTHLGLTFIYITHDQEEAINMSDRIAVMHEGLIEQIGTPSQVYDKPETSYVARFVGSANIIQGTVLHADTDTIAIENHSGTVLVPAEGIKPASGQRVTAAVRRENMILRHESINGNGLAAIVKEKRFAGGVLQIFAELRDGNELVATRYGLDSDINTGDSIYVSWAPENAVLVDRGELYEAQNAAVC